MSGWRPRLIVSDLDGTLLNRGRMSDRTWAAVEGARKSGVAFLVATGRTAGWLSPLLDRGYDGLAVCDNGALIYDIARDEVRHPHLIPASVVASVVTDVAAALPEVYFGVNRIVPDARAQFSEPGYVERWDYGQAPLARERLGDEDAAKIIVKVPHAESDKLGALIAPLVGDRVTLAWSQISAGLVECSAFGVTKVTGAAAVAAELGIEPADVLAMGDMNNDLDLLRWAGHSVAPANAHPDIQAVVDEVVGHIEDDGTAAYLERLLNL